jgi:oligopeptide transport system substrate-binding protein
VYEMRIADALFQGLTALDERTLQPVPAAAERWTVSDDGLEYTFYLRSNGRWSDGTPVTADDFAFAFSRILNPKFGAHYSNMLWPIKNAEAYNKGTIDDFDRVGVKVAGPLVLKITLERPTAYFAALASHTTLLPLQRGAIERHGRIDARDNQWATPGKLAGNGPFVLHSWQPNARMTLAKNPHYWGVAANKLNKIVIYPIDNADTEERMFRAGQLHVTARVPVSRIASYKQRDDPALRVFPYWRFAASNLILQRPLLIDGRFGRRWLYQSIEQHCARRYLTV